MPHIRLPDGVPGIRSALQLPSASDAALYLQLIATYVSAENDCRYCQTIHGAIAAHHLGGDEALVVQVKADPQGAPISEKLKALLAIAGKTARGGKHVTPDDIARARAQGATDLEIHETVLIAAVFCLCNRYVDGLATWTPDDPDFYHQRAALVATHGYVGVTQLSHSAAPAAVTSGSGT